MSKKKSKPDGRRGVPHRRITPAERMTILQLWTSGQGKVREIADAMRRPPSSIYNVLEAAGVWPGIDDYTKAPRPPAKTKAPGEEAKPKVEPVAEIQPTIVPPGTITLISGPKRSLWQRIKDFFS